MKDSFSGSLLVASSMVDAPMIQGGVCLLVHQDESSAIGVMLNRPLQASPEMLQGLIGDLPGSDMENSETTHNRLHEFMEPTDPFTDASPDDPWDIDQEAIDMGEDENLFAEDTVEENVVLGSSLDQAGEPQTSTPFSDIRSSFARSLHFGGPNSGPVVAVHTSSRHAEAETAEGIYVAAQRENLQRLICENQDPYRLIVGHLGWKLDQLRREISEGWWHVVPATSEAVFAGDEEMWRRLIHRATGSSLAKWIGVDDQSQVHRLN